jgi:hypothetical protein
MSWQWVFDNATSIGVNRRQTVTQTQSRNGRVNSLSSGGQVWEFRVTLPQVQEWAEARKYVEAIDYADRVTVETVQINNPQHEWIVGYRGDITTTTVIEASVPASGNVITLISNDTVQPGQFKFRAGDFIEIPIGSAIGRVYTVVEDVPHNVSQVTLNRPIIEAPALGISTLRIGQAVRWRLLATELPTWSFIARDLIAWEGEFTFIEV